MECAVRVWEAERGAAYEPGERVSRLKASTRILAEARRCGDGEAMALAADLESHRRRLERLRLRPADLTADTGMARALNWAVRRAHLMLPLAALIGLAGFVAFYPPYRLTGWIVSRVQLEEDERSTWKLLVGIGLYGAWLVAVVVVLTLAAGWRAGLLALAGFPLVGMIGLTVRERWRGSWADARRFVLLRSRRRLVAALQQEQGRLAESLQAVYDRYAAQWEARWTPVQRRPMPGRPATSRG